MPRLYRASLLGAAALIAGPVIGAVLALANARRCGLWQPTDRLTRWLDAHHPQ